MMNRGPPQSARARPERGRVQRVDDGAIRQMFDATHPAITLPGEELVERSGLKGQRLAGPLGGGGHVGPEHALRRRPKDLAHLISKEPGIGVGRVVTPWHAFIRRILCDFRSGDIEPGPDAPAAGTPHARQTREAGTAGEAHHEGLPLIVRRVRVDDRRRAGARSRVLQRRVPGAAGGVLGPLGTAVPGGRNVRPCDDARECPSTRGLRDERRIVRGPGTQPVIDRRHDQRPAVQASKCVTQGHRVATATAGDQQRHPRRE